MRNRFPAGERLDRQRESKLACKDWKGRRITNCRFRPLTAATLGVRVSTPGRISEHPLGSTPLMASRSDETHRRKENKAFDRLARWLGDSSPPDEILIQA